MIAKLRKDLPEVLSTAWPLMLSTGLFSVTLFVDRWMLYGFSDSAAAAALGAGTILWSINCLPIGICGYTNTFVAQYLSAKRPTRALQVVWQGVLLGLLCGPVLLALGLFSEPLFSLVGHERHLAEQEAEYFVWLIPGTWATIIASSLTGLFSGSGRSMILLYTDMVVTVVNGVLDYVLIFGVFGFPVMGVRGAALASSIALILKLVVLAWMASRDFRRKSGIMHANQDLETAEERGTRVRDLLKRDWPLMQRLVHFGWPAGVSVVAEAWCFTAIMVFVGRLGDQAAAATTLALNVNLLAFIPLVGLGTAIGVLVGKYLVQEQVEKAKRMVFSGLLIGIAYSLIFVILYGFFPEWVMTIYSFDSDPERFEKMRPVLKPLLLFIACYCVFDAFQMVFVGALKGAGDTRFVLGGHLFAGSATLIGGIAFSTMEGMGGLYYWWSVITVWVVLLAVIFTLRYLQGGWQTKRVIEAQIVE
ncbi:MAG: MATE family efflux transporter [Planctomycetota bacterium]|nr:MATE family efflux transporter [Planctomycetota bacterium]